MTKVVPLVLIVLGLSLPSRTQQTDSTWLFPTDGALRAAAKRGYEGGKAGKFKPVPLAVRGKCGQVYTGHIATPIQIALSLGAQKRQKFESFPSDQEILAAKGQLGVNLVVVPDDPDTDAEVALAWGNKLDKPKQKQIVSKELSEVPCAITLFQPSSRWLVTFLYVFQFETGESAPAGKGKLLVRQSDGKEQEIIVDFNRFARSNP